MLDTEPLAARAWAEAAAALGVAFDHAVTASLVGRNFRRLPGAGPRAPRRRLSGRRADAAWHVAYDAIVEREGIALKPGLVELLEWLDETRHSQGGRDVDAPRARASEARAHRARSAASPRSSAATRSRAASRRPTSSSWPRRGSRVAAERVRRARGFRAGRARRARRRHDADHGARPGAAVAPRSRARRRCVLAPRSRRARASRRAAGSLTRRRRAIIAPNNRARHDRPPHRNPRREEPAADPARRAGRGATRSTCR